ncbi:hypothetical protein [Arcticibacterium luteifluviistationis]|uniref:ABC transporter ATPase n=1 Tax=Arcticibacterium luteifluviistationis TaxID=1784714 RepID=A0A2Z4GFF6_9BACT|nr:hypothetical protein [Arcticibacterium luteifluviistationis]AWV99970.1 hypothetical protein DJ013_18055 [Arcticibacterium luteifluviistationis]
MYQDFDKMPIQSRVWIYQADRNLSAKEENITAYFLKNAIQDWAAHGAPLLASVSVLENRFVVIALDENQNVASGCSIDASTHWIKELGTQLSVDFFDRSIAYLDDVEVKTVPVFKVKAAVENASISADTVVFNNNIMTLQEFRSSWKTTADKLPFLAKHIKKISLA